MAKIAYIQVSESSGGVGALKSHIERIDLRSLTKTFASMPKEGYCHQYPVADDKNNILYYELELGKNVNTNANDATLVVNGVQRPKPVWREGLFGILSCGWGPAGHAAISPMGNKLIHSARVDKYFFGGWPYSQEWQLIETDFLVTQKSQKVISKVNNCVEPNWSGGGVVYIDKNQQQHYVCVNDIRIASPGLAFDPILSPDESKVAWLVLEGKIGSNALDNLFNVKWSIYVCELNSPNNIKKVVKEKQWTLNSQPHWLDDATIVISRTESVNDPWRLISVDINSSKETLMFPDDNRSMGMAWFVH